MPEVSSPADSGIFQLRGGRRGGGGGVRSAIALGRRCDGSGEADAAGGDEGVDGMANGGSLGLPNADDEAARAGAGIAGGAVAGSTPIFGAYGCGAGASAVSRSDCIRLCKSGMGAAAVGVVC